MAIIRCMLAVMVVWLLLAGICLGKQVYLRDGAVIDSESFWRSGDRVMVKVNRDILLEFDASEVNGPKTFGAAKKRATHKHLRKTLAGSKKDGVVTAAVTAPAGSPGQGTQQPQANQPASQPAAANNPAPAPAAAVVAKVAAPVSAPAQVTPAVAPPEPVQASVAESSSPPDKAELQRRSREAAEMMAEALKKQDPELMKKAVEAQKSVMAAQKGAMQAQGQGASTVQQEQQRSMGVKILLIMLVSLLLMVISTWVVFQKAGQPGWHSIIPIFNMYVMMEISGKPWWWMLLLFVPILGLVIYLLAMIALAERFGRSLVYGLGLFFLPMFFFPMLAFGGAQYEG